MPEVLSECAGFWAIMVPSEGMELRTLNPARVSSEGSFESESYRLCTCSVPRGSRPASTWERRLGSLGARASYSGGERVTWTDENVEGVKVVAANTNDCVSQTTSNQRLWNKIASLPPSNNLSTRCLSTCLVSSSDVMSDWYLPSSAVASDPIAKAGPLTGTAARIFDWWGSIGGTNSAVGAMRESTNR